MRGIRRLSLFAALAALTVSSGVVIPEGEAAPVATRVSVASDGTQANGPNGLSDISANANIVAFESSASNLVTGDTNTVQDIFARNRVTNQTERVSISDTEVQADGASANPETSTTGQFVAFDSTATNLAPADANGAVRDVFRRDRANNATALVSISTGNVNGNADSFGPNISGDGRFVAFTSMASTLAPDADGAVLDAFLRDTQANTTEIVSLSDADVQSGGNDAATAVSSDGNLVLFHSDSAALTTTPTADPDTNLDLFLRNRSAGTTEIVSVSSNNTKGNGSTPSASDTSFGSAMSSDGRFVVFSSDATNLVADDTNAAPDIFVRDRQLGTTTRVSVDSGGRQANGASLEPSISPDGRLVAFSSLGTNLIEGDTNAQSDVFVHDRTTRKTFRVSEGSQLNGPSNFPSLSASTTPFVSFTSLASNAVANDTNGVSDIFVRAALEARGYLILDDVGGFFTFGEAQFFDSVPGLRNAGVPIGQAKVIDMAVTPTGSGYLALDDVGGIFSFGDSVFRGSVPGLRAAGTCPGGCPSASIDIAMTSTGLGYFILDDQGGIFTFGDAAFQGSLPSLRQAGVSVGNARAIDIAVTPTGGGYWILDEAGGVFTFGDAQFFGSVPGLRAAGVSIGNAPGIRFEETPSGLGYFVLDGAGGIFTFGDAVFQGSIPGLRAAGTVVGPAAGVDFAVTPAGQGYHILDDQGGIFTFGDATFFGSVPALRQAGVNIGPAPSIRIETVA